ncbi:hypothetical protein BJ322DRAFT_873988 [Thelephora terrestris]|uniref:Uncharacterized protein n=1 Tax=Thelephora terrestris TaxID=56493 RepID=A0A9P6HBJ6_9AGAM|nr:hypothetical protein BJ322DRAFT_873988 [Thelephora terrestris]
MFSIRPGHLENATGHHHQLKGAPKTPGRQLKSAALRENAQSVHKIVLGGKQTPFQGKAQQSTSKVLGEKTPFHHNRQDPLFTPAPQTFKIVKFALEDDEPELPWLSSTAPTSTFLRPSSTRKSIRGRLSGGDGDKGKEEERFGPLGLKGLQLQTPMNPKNRHWDFGDLDLEASAEVEPIAEEQEDDDEIEYMPPKVEVPYQPPFDFEMPNYKVLGTKLREMARSYKYEEDPVLDDFDYVFDISPAELELLNPIDLVPSSDEGGDNPFLGPPESKLKSKPASGTVKPSAASSKIPTKKPLTATTSSQRLIATKTRPIVASASRNKTTSTAKPSRPADTTRTATTSRPPTASRSTAVMKPTLTARPVKSSATTKAISPRKQAVSRTAGSQVRPMKPLVPVQKSNNTVSLSTTRSRVVSRPPSSATTRKVGTTASALVGKKPTGATSKGKEDELILKFDVQDEIEEFQFDV